MHECIEMLVFRPGMPAKCELWRDRVLPPGSLAVVYGGKVWSDFSACQGQTFSCRTTFLQTYP